MHYTVRTAAESESTYIKEPWGSLRWLASAPVGNAEGVTVGHVIIRPGQANPRHSHTTCEEVLYLLRGRLRHSMGEETVVLEAGDLPSGTYVYRVVAGESAETRTLVLLK